MDRFDQLWIWDDRALAAALDWYRAVAANRKPAKFRIAATIPTTIPGALDLAAGPEAALWDELERLTPVFLERLRRIREDAEPLGPPAAGESLLGLCRALAWRMLTHCDFCAWDCRVDRSQGAKFGACKLSTPSGPRWR